MSYAESKRGRTSLSLRNNEGSQLIMPVMWQVILFYFELGCWMAGGSDIADDF